MTCYQSALSFWYASKCVPCPSIISHEEYVTFEALKEFEPLRQVYSDLFVIEINWVHWPLASLEYLVDCLVSRIPIVLKARAYYQGQHMNIRTSKSRWSVVAYFEEVFLSRTYGNHSIMHVVRSPGGKLTSVTMYTWLHQFLLGCIWNGNLQVFTVSWKWILSVMVK